MRPESENTMNDPSVTHSPPADQADLRGAMKQLTNIEEAYYIQLVTCRVPVHLQDGLVLYLVHHKKPGSFLLAVLKNNLRDACGSADETSGRHLPELVRFLYSHAPAVAWGNHALVTAWLQERPS